MAERRAHHLAALARGLAGTHARRQSAHVYPLEHLRRQRKGFVRAAKSRTGQGGSGKGGHTKGRGLTA